MANIHAPVGKPTTGQGREGEESRTRTNAQRTRCRKRMNKGGHRNLTDKVEVSAGRTLKDEPDTSPKRAEMQEGGR